MEIYNGCERKEFAFKLLISDKLLFEQLNAENIPVPFESILHDELDEINQSRSLRLVKYQSEIGVSSFEKCIFHVDSKPELVLNDDCQDHEMELRRYYKKGSSAPAIDHLDTFNSHALKISDPLIRAKSMSLYGLAFSGGGIRSATFNLGILQRLAEQGLLEKFDYLSTVSGGGYIGSWFASWVSRARSISKVNDRLNPQNSEDPMGEEVRPIRWLRMFSNYLSPNASLMSDDAWTLGITWLRNTLINQVLLLLLLCTALFGIQFVFHYWYTTVDKYTGEASTINIAIGSAIIFIPASFFAGFGMRAYHQPLKSPFSHEKNTLFANLLILWGTISSFFISSWFLIAHINHTSITSKIYHLSIAGIIGFTALMIVAYIGKYWKQSAVSVPIAWVHIIGSSLVAAFIGTTLLACCWQMYQHITQLGVSQNFRLRLGFTLGMPLIVTVLSIVVVTRMALLGLVFPDERREWWGRIGAIAHKKMLMWILISAAILFLPNLGIIIGKNPVKNLTNLVAGIGGWGTIIGYALKIAYNPKTSGEKPSKGSSAISEVFVQIAPYLFALGVLIIGTYISRFIYLKLLLNTHWPFNHLATGLILCISTGIIGVLISLRIGVNEFSLHHFYRNRLVRAYLGATKRLKQREETVNTFTNFNKFDDLKFTSLRTSEGYSGPFMIVNTALNTTVITDELDRQDRKAESFVFTSKYCGFDCSRTRSASRSAKKSYDYAYRPTEKYSEHGGPQLGTAMAISGAAVNPNMGYHSASATAFLLTVFNLRLGWWIGNPRKSNWKESDPKFGLAYLLSDLIGKSDARSSFVCLSDGGHFDNMGIYELIRRRCKYILLGDAEEDDDASCEGLANAIRRCRIDFGVEVTIDIEPITKKNKKGFCKRHHVSGTIWYPGDDAGKPSGVLTYIKTALTGKESVDVREYFIENPEFPQQSTADQFFDESQFESYRKLGYLSL